MDHDYGFAPNPFWGVMTLATCKGMLRHSRNLEMGYRNRRLCTS